MTHQAISLGYLPRLEVRHTSSTTYGQIYVPLVNWMLMIATLMVVVGFGSSSRLASAYGIAVTATMAITTVLFFVVARERWVWSRARALTVTVVFILVDISFFGANIVKVADGGWLPLSIALAGFVVMSTWRAGREQLRG